MTFREVHMSYNWFYSHLASLSITIMALESMGRFYDGFVMKGHCVPFKVTDEASQQSVMS
jgi:hypothetical protein